VNIRERIRGIGRVRNHSFGSFTKNIMIGRGDTEGHSYHEVFTWHQRVLLPGKLFVDRKTVVLGSIGKELSEYIRKYCN
jgi:hypothetical protein